jgi:hypothetical protein
MTVIHIKMSVTDLYFIVFLFPSIYTCVCVCVCLCLIVTINQQIIFYGNTNGNDHVIISFITKYDHFDST